MNDDNNETPVGQFGAADIINAARAEGEDTPKTLVLEDVRRLDVRPGDVLILRTASALNDAQRQRVAEWCAKVFPQDVNMLVLGPDWQVEVVRGAPADPPEEGGADVSTR
jgi:hypothetical protein